VAVTTTSHAAAAREPRGRDRGRGGGAEPAEQLGFDDCREPRFGDREQDDEERRPARQPRVGLEPREAELAVDAGHHGEDAVR
jgi:hypothetical protein